MRLVLARHMSTSAMDFGGDSDSQAHGLVDHSESKATTAMANELILGAQNTKLTRAIGRLQADLQPFTKESIQELEKLADNLARERADLEYEYAEKINEHRALQEGTSDLLKDEEAVLTETLRELEILGARLEYELSTLVSKVEDVEDGVVDYEHQVQDLETRVQMLGTVEQQPRSWARRLLGL